MLYIDGVRENCQDEMSNGVSRHFHNTTIHTWGWTTRNWLYCTSIQKLFLEVDSSVNSDSYRGKNCKNGHWKLHAVRSVWCRWGKDSSFGQKSAVKAWRKCNLRISTALSPAQMAAAHWTRAWPMKSDHELLFGNVRNVSTKHRREAGTFVQLLSGCNVVCRKKAWLPLNMTSIVSNVFDFVLVPQIRLNKVNHASQRNTINTLACSTVWKWR